MENTLADKLTELLGQYDTFIIKSEFELAERTAMLVYGWLQDYNGDDNDTSVPETIRR